MSLPPRVFPPTNPPTTKGSPMTTTKIKAAPVPMAIENIDPDRAAELLSGNDHNRSLRPALVRKYARDMRAGNWSQTGDPIRLAADATLLDGQHRLAAIIEARATIPMVVVRNVEKRAILNIDTGAKRTFADTLKLMGYTNVNHLGSAVRFMVLYEAGLAGTNAQITNSEMLAWLDENPVMVQCVAEVTNKRGSGVSPETRGSITALFALRFLCDKHEFEVFYERFKTGAGLEEGSAILALRRYCTNAAIGTKRSPAKVIQAVTIKAWNAWIQGRDVSHLRYSPGGAMPEPFPQIVVPNRELDAVA